MTDAQLQQVREALTIASQYCRDPDDLYDELYGARSFTTGYVKPLTEIQRLEKQIEDVKRKKSDAKLIRDTLASL